MGIKESIIGKLSTKRTMKASELISEIETEFNPITILYITKSLGDLVAKKEIKLTSIDGVSRYEHVKEE